MKQLEYALLSHKKCQKTLEPSFKRPYALSVGFKMKPLRKRVFPCYGETNSNYAVKVAQKSNCFLIYLSNIFTLQHSKTQFSPVSIVSINMMMRGFIVR